MEKTIIKCESTTSFSSILGSLTSFSSNFFKNKFPNGFFKKLVISESLNSSNMSDSDIQKHQLPLLTIKPELSMDSTYMEQLPSWYTSTQYIAHNSKRKNYYPVLRDEEKGIYIYSIPSRMKVNFNIKIKVPTTMFMYNTMHYIQNKFVMGDFQYINDVRLQTEVPKVMMINLAETLGLDLTSVDDREQFNSYLAKNSLNGISENINLSTGNNNYAYNFVSNILVNYPDNVSGDKNVKNLVVEDGTISFMYSMELWIPNKYLLELPNNRQELTTVYEESNDTDRFKFNIVVNNDYIKPMIDGKHLIIRKAFIPDVNIEYDELDFSPIVNTELTSIINVLIDKGLFNETLVDLHLMCGNKFLRKEDYEVDYKNRILKTKNPMSNTTYTILIYGDLQRLNYVSDLINTSKIDDLKMI